VLHLIFAGNALFAVLGLVFALRIREPQRSTTPREHWYHSFHLLRPLLVVGLLAGSAGGMILPVQVLLLNDRFGTGTAGAILAYAVPGIVYAVAPEPLGRWADRHSHTVAAAVGLGIPILTYLLLPFAPSLASAGVLLCIEAFGISLSTPALNALIADRVPAQRGSGYALYTMTAGLGSAAGSAAGGWLYGHWAPAAPYLIAAACLAIGALWIVMGRGHGAV
jgi:MFS family permease